MLVWFVTFPDMLVVSLMIETTTPYLKPDPVIVAGRVVELYAESGLIEMIDGEAFVMVNAFFRVAD